VHVKAKLTAAATQLLPPSDSTGMSGTTQTLEPSASWGRASNPQEDSAEWAASPVYTRYPFNSWVDWSNVGKVSYSRKQQQHQSVLSRDRACNLSISRLMP